MSAVKDGEFSETLIAYHPGVTTMWVAGLRTFFVEPRVNVQNLARARGFIGIVIWIGIGGACILLYRLFGRLVALAGFACLAYSPLFLAQTRRVHTDALATIFIFLTVLLFLCYCQSRRHHRFLVLSGIAFGLGVLSKSYALILLLWLPFCLFFFQSRAKHDRRLYTHITEVLCFLNCAVLTTLALWPVFWTPGFGIIALGLLGLTVVLLKENLKDERGSIMLVGLSGIGLVLTFTQIIRVLKIVVHSVNWAVTTPHEVEHFFFGKIVNDPGWLFYPFILTLKSTPLMVPLALVGCILLWKARKRSEEAAHQFRMVLALVAGVVLFTVCLSATSKKFSRYLLPAFPMFEILAAIVFVEGFKWSYAVLSVRFAFAVTTYKNALAIIACLAFFFIQVLPVLALHPYYGTYYNPCWKVTDITKIIKVGEASGVDLAAKYLNEKDDATQMHIQASYIAREFLGYYFVGKIHHIPPKQMIDSYPNIPMAYEVIYIRDSQIGWAPQEGLKGGTLEHVVRLNGIDLVWIYRVPPLEEERP